MKLGQQLNIKQNQSLIMTPQLQQAIKLLQLTNIELSDFIEKAQLENPFLQETKEFIDHFKPRKKNSKKVQQGQTTQAGNRDQTPRNVTDGLRNLALAFLGFTLALFAHFGLKFNEAIPCARRGV